MTLSSDGSSVALVVADTGAGIAPEFLPYVFDRFRQADQSFTRAHGGLGLGLAIVKHLVEMHGGEVTASSDGVGLGARFHVRLPVAKTQASGVERRQGMRVTTDPDRLPDVDLSDLFILVVDDDEATRELLVTMLTQCRARAEAVASASLALARFDIEVPALLIADIGMPDEDRAVDDAPDPPAIRGVRWGSAGRGAVRVCAAGRPSSLARGRLRRLPHEAGDAG